jgi:hypothetical protein
VNARVRAEAEKATVAENHAQDPYQDETDVIRLWLEDPIFKHRMPLVMLE